MKIKDKELYTIINRLGIKYIENIEKYQKEDNEKLKIFYEGKLDTILEICMNINSPIFTELQIEIEEMKAK